MGSNPSIGSCSYRHLGAPAGELNSSMLARSDGYYGPFLHPLVSLVLGLFVSGIENERASWDAPSSISVASYTVGCDTSDESNHRSDFPIPPDQGEVPAVESMVGSCSHETK